MSLPVFASPDGPASSDARADPLALYVHWPFCVSKCPYCDFNSHVRQTVDEDAWRRALLTDLAHEAALTGGRPLSSLFFGGGTPSLMPPAIVAALIEAAENAWGFTPDIEITLEANPNSVEAARFADLAAAGVNRVSLGLQALEDEALHFLGRAHSVTEALAALDAAQRLFGRVSIDLIYARPGQSEADWVAELEQALSFGTGHASLYQLTIEAGTRFATDVAQGRLTPADPDHGATLYERTQAVMNAAGLPAYEISNHARPGQQSRHNLTYWRYDDYAGIGPGAHGRRSGMATVRHRKPENWIGAVARNGHGLRSEEILAPQDRAREALLMGLRLGEGVDLDRIAAKTGLDRATLLNPAGVERMAKLGLIRVDGHRVVTLPAGMLLLDAILPELVAV
ncbi:MAG: radical SAM family heme chaperone HemW [Sphingobium sp.]